MNFDDLYPERSITTMLLATMMASFITSIMVGIFALGYALTQAETIDILPMLAFPLYLLPIFLFCVATSIIPMMLLGPPLAHQTVKLIKPNSLTNIIILYGFGIFFGMLISAFIVYSISMNGGVDLLMSIGAIWGASAAYMWDKLMLKPSPEDNDKEYV